LGDAEAALHLAARDRRQHAPALLLAAEHRDRVQAEQVDVHRRRRRHAAARLRDRLHHDRRLGDAEARAAVLLADAHAEPAVVGQRPVELLGEAAVVVAVEPVGVVEARADLGDRVADAFLLLAEGEVHADPRSRDAALEVRTAPWAIKASISSPLYPAWVSTSTLC